MILLAWHRNTLEINLNIGHPIKITHQHQRHCLLTGNNFKRQKNQSRDNRRTTETSILWLRITSLTYKVNTVRQRSGCQWSRILGKALIKQEHYEGVPATLQSHQINRNRMSRLHNFTRWQKCRSNIFINRNNNKVKLGMSNILKRNRSC